MCVFKCVLKLPIYLQTKSHICSSQLRREKPELKEVEVERMAGVILAKAGWSPPQVLTKSFSWSKLTVLSGSPPPPSSLHWKPIPVQVVAYYMGWSYKEAADVARGGPLPVAPLLPAQVANPAPPKQPEVSFKENYHITFEAWQFNIFGTRHEQMIHYRLLWWLIVCLYKSE